MAQRARKKPPLKVQAIPPPVGGWNARDLYNTMDDKDALVLDNWIPDVSAVRVRGGSVAYATGLPSYVDTLMEFSTTSGVYKLLAGLEIEMVCIPQNNRGIDIVTKFAGMNGFHGSECADRHKNRRLNSSPIGFYQCRAGIRFTTFGL